MKVGIIANPHKPGARSALDHLLGALAARGLEAMLERRTASLSGRSGGLDGADLASLCDVLVVLGGDGTMLHGVSSIGGTDKPVAGVNIGTLGFLTTVTDGEIEEFADALVEENVVVSPRTLLAARVIRADGSESGYLALNEAVLARGNTGRLVSMRATVDGEFLNEYRADGLIVATPTGSTAYSLSAGGPLISPSAGVFVITPVCPHTLSQRSLVLDDRVVIGMEPHPDADEPMLFTADGRDCVEVAAGDRVEVKRADRELKLLRLKGGSFYEALRQKLNWRGG